MQQPGVADRRPGPGLSLALALATTLCACGGASGQLDRLFGGGGSGATVYRHARILTMTNGRGVIEDGSIVVLNGQIQQLGKEVKVPEGAQEVDLGGMTVTPGLIDVNGTLGMGTEGSSAGAAR